jgi:hypothetical protein
VDQAAPCALREGEIVNREYLRTRVAAQLRKLEDIFGKPGDRYELTFVARHVSDRSAHVVVSSERDYSEAANAIHELSKQEDAVTVGAPSLRAGKGTS